MTTFIQVPANSPVAATIQANTAQVDPTYLLFLETGQDISEWGKFKDAHENPAEDLGLAGRTWEAMGDLGLYYAGRKQAPEGEYRREWLPSGRLRTYKTVEKAEGAATRLNKKVS